jgi:hypothetical protein
LLAQQETLAFVIQDGQPQKICLAFFQNSLTLSPFSAGPMIEGEKVKVTPVLLRMPEPVAQRSWSKYDSGITLALFGVTLGADGWILGAAFGLLTGAAQAQPQPAGIGWDILVVFLCALGVPLAGVFLWRFYLSGRRLSRFFVIETLLGSSFVFGTCAIVWMHARGVLALAVAGSAETGQPGDAIWIALSRHLPPELTYAAPLIILALMAAAWWPPCRKRLFGADAHLQQGTPEGERPWHLPPLPCLFPGRHAPPDRPNS